MKIHIVQQGDTLFDLSKKYGVPLQKLIESNPQLANPDQLNIGDKVKIPTVGVSVGGNGGNVIYKHVVKQGDTLWKLSNAWGIPLQSLINANPQLSNPDELTVGEFVNIPSGGKNDNMAPPVHQGSSTIEGKANTAPINQGGKKNTAPIESIPAPVVPEPVPVVPVPVVPPVVETPPVVPAPQPVVPQYNIDVEYSKISAPNYIFEIQQPPVYQVMPEYKPEPAPYIPEYKPEPIKASPCGCGPSLSEHLFMQYPVEAEKVSGFYNYPQVIDQPFQQQMHYPSPAQSHTGEYPGISNAPVYEWPQTYPVTDPCHHQGWPGQPTPYGFSPEQNIADTNYYHHGHNHWGMECPEPYGPSHSHNPFGYAPYEGYPSYQPSGQFQPYGHMGMGMQPQESYVYPQQSVVPQSPLGGFGVSDVIRDQREEDAEGFLETAGTETKRDKARDEVQTPQKREAKKEGKKARISSSNQEKKERSNSKAGNKRDTKQNPWINE